MPGGWKRISAVRMPPEARVAMRRARWVPRGSQSVSSSWGRGGERREDPARPQAGEAEDIRLGPEGEPG